MCLFTYNIETYFSHFELRSDPFFFSWAGSGEQKFEPSPLNTFKLRLKTVQLFISVQIQKKIKKWTCKVQGGPYITANLYCICLSEYETCAKADAVQICGNIWNAQHISKFLKNTFSVHSRFYLNNRVKILIMAILK